MVLCLLAVWTARGQRFEDGILEAAERGVNDVVAGFARYALEKITNVTAGLAVVVVVAIGLVQRRVVLAASAGGVVLASVATTQVVQHVMVRPILLSHGLRREDQSFPSGHVAIALSITCALVLVVPFRLRTVVAVVGSVLASGMAVAAVVSDWHRPADAVGSDLIVLTYSCLAVAILAARQRVGDAPEDRTVPGGRPVIVAALLGLGVLGAVAYDRMADRVTGSFIMPASVPVAPGWLLGLTLLLVFAGGVAATAMLYALVRRYDLGVRRVADDRTGGATAAPVPLAQQVD